MKLLTNKTSTKMKKSILFTMSIILFFFISCTPNNSVKSNKSKSIYEKVIETGKIRAAYTIYPPGCFKDKSGKLKGVFVETLEKAAESLDLKVEWTESVGWATQIEGLDNNRYDMIGSSVWANPKRAKFATLSIPLFYSPLFIYTRKEESRFDKLNDFHTLNSNDYIISTVDGGTGEVIVKNQFPKAKRLPLPQDTDFAQSFMDVVGRKADFVIMEPFQANKFLSSNPNTIKSILPNNPLRVFGNCYMFKKGEFEFEHMLNVVLQDLLNSGYVNSLIDKYEIYPNSYSRVSPSFSSLN